LARSDFYKYDNIRLLKTRFDFEESFDYKTKAKELESMMLKCVDLYNKLIETNVPIREQLNRLSYYMDIEDYLNEELKKGYIHYNDILTHLKKEDIEIYINDGYFTIAYPIDDDKQKTFFEEDVDGKLTSTIKVPYEIFFTNNIDKIIEGFKTDWQRIIQRNLFFKNTASVSKLQNQIIFLNKGARIKIEIDGEYFDISSDFTTDTSNNLVLKINK
jgi:hypothetical protein